MRTRIAGRVAAAVVVPSLLLVASAGEAAAQKSRRPTPEVDVRAEISISTGDRERIQAYYAEHPYGSVEALPPGIRKNLARGKPLPPGIAKKVAHADLLSAVTIPERYELVEVGVDVFLVEVATGIIHDVLMDVIR